MMAAVKVKPNIKQDKMSATARINYGRMYTVRHDVPVYDFGIVEEGNLHVLNGQWRAVLNYKTGLRSGRSEDEHSESRLDHEVIRDSSQTLQVSATSDDSCWQQPATVKWDYQPDDDGFDNQELELQAGDQVRIKEIHNEHWVWGICVRTDSEGYIPRANVTYDPIEGLDSGVSFI
jgi:hypothetical protein